MKRVLQGAIASVLLTFMFSCGSDSDSGSSAVVAPAATFSGKCEVASNNLNPGPICTDVSDVTEDQLAAFEESVCANEDLPGTYTADASCSEEDVIHTCDIEITELGMTISNYFYASHTTETGTLFCDNIEANL